MKLRKSDVGKRVTFRVCTRHSNNKVTRIIKTIHPISKSITVRYEGWDNFWVHNHEIIKIHKEE